METGYDKSFNSWNDKKDIHTIKMIYYQDSHTRNKIKVQLGLLELIGTENFSC